MSSQDRKNELGDSLPEAVRMRLKELSEKLYTERQNLDEAALLREEAWNSEKDQLKQEISALKAEKEALAGQLETSAADKDTIASMEEEAKGRAQAWDAERVQFEKDAESSREELRLERKHWSEKCAEAASLHAELKKREEAWNSEKDQLKQEISALKAEKEALVSQDEGSAADKETIASLEEEAKGRAQAWNTEKAQLKKDADNIREELRAERKQWSDIRAEWKTKFDKMVETAKTGAERETFLSEKLRAAESTLEKLEPELQRREDDYRRALSQMEADQQKQMNAALGALDEMLSKKDKKKDGPK